MAIFIYFRCFRIKGICLFFFRRRKLINEFKFNLNISGIDLSDVSSVQPGANSDIARSVKSIARGIKNYQDYFTALEKVSDINTASFSYVEY